MVIPCAEYVLQPPLFSDQRINSMMKANWNSKLICSGDENSTDKSMNVILSLTLLSFFPQFVQSIQSKIMLKQKLSLVTCPSHPINCSMRKHKLVMHLFHSTRKFLPIILFNCVQFSVILRGGNIFVCGQSE